MRVGLWVSDLMCFRFVLWFRQYQNIIVNFVSINFVNWHQSYKAQHMGQTWKRSLPADTDDPIAGGWWRTDPGRCGSSPALVPSSTATGAMSSMALITVTESFIVINNPSFYRGQVSLLLSLKRQVLTVDFQRERPQTDLESVSNSTRWVCH